MEAGSTTMRWKPSRCTPSASATIALITSPWLHTSHSAPGPCSALTRASQSRTAATARADIAAIGSPPGKVAADGCCWTTFHSGSLASFLSGWPSHSPYPHSVSRSSTCGVTSGSARPRVSRQRTRGLLTTAASGTPASRSPAAFACSSPVSSSRTGWCPARVPPALAVVRPCRSRMTVATRASLRRGDHAGREQCDEAQPDGHPVPHERDDRVARDELQQPRDRRVRDEEAHDGANQRRDPADGPGDVPGRRDGLQRSRRAERRDAEEERQPGGGDPVDAAQQPGADRGTGPGHAGDQRDALGEPDDEAVGEREVLLAALLGGRVLGVDHRRRPHDERVGNHPQAAQRALDERFGRQPDDGDRQRAGNDDERHPPVLLPARLGTGQAPREAQDEADDVAAEVDDRRRDRPHLDDRRVRGDAHVVYLDAHQPLGDGQVAGRGDRQELGDPLDDAEEDRLPDLHVVYSARPDLAYASPIWRSVRTPSSASPANRATDRVVTPASA